MNLIPLNMYPVRKLKRGRRSPPPAALSKPAAPGWGRTGEARRAGVTTFNPLQEQARCLMPHLGPGHGHSGQPGQGVIAQRYTHLPTTPHLVAM